MIHFVQDASMTEIFFRSQEELDDDEEVTKAAPTIEETTKSVASTDAQTIDEKVWTEEELSGMSQSIG